MKNPKMFLVAVMVLALALLACDLTGGGGETPGEGAVAPAPSDAAITSDEGAPAAAGSTEGASEAGGATVQDLSLSTLTEGLAGLRSYKSTFTVAFVGTDEQGQPVDGSLETYEEFTQEPRAQRVSFNTSGGSQRQLGESGTFEMITIGDTSYMVTQDADGARSCVAVSSSEGTQPEQGLFSPDAMGGITDARYAGKEAVNGVETKKYTWDQAGLPGLDWSSAQGEVWVAEDGDYVVKYTAEATGQGMLFGLTEEEGTVTVEYNLTDVNGSFQIAPPADCEAPASDIPIMADAQDKTSVGEMVSYSSGATLDDVVAFHETEMPKNGWQTSGEATSMEGFATLEFTKDGRKAQVMITRDNDKQVTNIMITSSEE